MLLGSHGLIENQIKDWVRRHVCVVDKDNGRCKKILLRHLNVDKKPQSDVHSVVLSGDPSVDGTEIADKVVADLADAAQRDANDYQQGIQTYAIYAFYTGNANYAPRKIFRVGADDTVERESDSSEPPTEKGLLSQLMRHNEINTKNSLVAMGYILQTFQKEIGQQRDQNRIFLQQQIDMTILVQDVLNEGAKRRIEEKQAEMQTSMFEGVFEHLKIGLPILLNRLAGKEIFAPKMDRELYLLASMFETMDPAQQMQLQNMLSPAQMSMLAELLQMYEDRKNKFLVKQGDDTEESNEGGGEKKNGSPTSKPAPGKNRLLAMFEKRGDLVKSEQVIPVEDARTKRIEALANQTRNRLKDVRKTLDEPGDE